MCVIFYTRAPDLLTDCESLSERTKPDKWVCAATTMVGCSSAKWEKTDPRQKSWGISVSHWWSRRTWGCQGQPEDSVSALICWYWTFEGDGPTVPACPGHSRGISYVWAVHSNINMVTRMCESACYCSASWPALFSNWTKLMPEWKTVVFLDRVYTTFNIYWTLFLYLRWTLQWQHRSPRGWCAQSQTERRSRACPCHGLSSFLLRVRAKVIVFVCHCNEWFKGASLSPPFSEANMEMILFLDFLSSGTDGSGRELWLADCESLGPPPWLLILTGGAGGLSSHRTLSHIYTGMHLHVWQRDRRLDDSNKHREKQSEKRTASGQS